jgi:KaiC/GvpD/RAD55 family RecA-like ATPase
MQDIKNHTMPTGITSLDPILEGGVPEGSVILLLANLGAGSHEFVFSSIVNLLAMKKETQPPEIKVPEEIRYITFTRLQDNIKNEIISSFNVEGANTAELINNIHFDDLSDHYFDSSIVPNEWYSKSDVISRLQKRSGQDSILVQLAKLINDTKEGSLVIFDSITDIATQCTTVAAWQNLTGLLRGLQRISKQRGITIYLLLSQGILSPSRESELADISDALLLFKWEESTGSRRQRVMYFAKFRGVMPHLEERDLVKFAIRISTTSGFEVSNIRVVI